MEKDLKVQQMEREMNELKRKRDLAESQLEQERRAKKEPKGSKECGPSRQVAKCLSFTTENAAGISRHLTETLSRKACGRQLMVRQSATSIDPSMLMHEIRKLEILQRQLGEEANHELELLHKEVAYHRLGSQDTTETIAKLLSDIKDMHTVSFVPEEVEIKDKASLKEEITRLNSEGNNIASLEEKLENVQKSIDRLITFFPSGEETPECKTQLRKKKILPFSLSNTLNMPHIIRSPCSLSSRKIMEYEIENRTPESNDSVSGSDAQSDRHKATPLKSHDDGNRILSREGIPASRRSNSVNVKKMQKMFKTAAEENIQSIKAYVTELKERVAKLQYQKQLLVCQVLELEANEGANDETDIVDQSPVSWHLVFEEQRKGDPSDQIYIEVELYLAELGNASPTLIGDEPAGSVSSSIKALKHEREYLAKRVSSKLSADDREMLYLKWDIPPEGKQKRRLQLVNKLWTDPHKMQHVRESAEVVAKLVGFCESGEHVSKEMFQLNFVTPCDKKTWMGWNLISNLLHL